MKKKLRVFKNWLDALVQDSQNSPGKFTKKIEKDPNRELYQSIISEGYHLIDWQATEQKSKEKEILKNWDQTLIEVVSLCTFNSAEKIERLIGIIEENQISL